MKTYIKTLALVITLQATCANAIIYYQSKDGAIAKIDEAVFKLCNNIIYRESAKDELPKEFNRKLLASILKGTLVSNPVSASDALKKDNGSCTYSALDDIK
jgi:hypothetical protein